MSARAALLAVAVGGLGCAAVTEFDPGRLAEIGEALCADGLDNDGNGLADCQEFGCLDMQHCCVLPRIYLSDRFETVCAQKPCASPDGGVSPDGGASPDGGDPPDGGASPDGGAANCIDEARWQAWGTPDPMVCEGALVVDKRENSYEIGVRGRQPLLMGPDLRIAVGVAGRLSGVARRSIWLTLQDDIPGSHDPLAAIIPVEPILGLAAEATADGYLFVARYDRVAVGTSAVVTDESRHEAGIQFGSDGRVHFLLDGQEFAASPADLPVPGAVNAYLVLAGVGRGERFIRFTDVQVTARIQCDTPGAWAPAADFLTLPKAKLLSSAWDGFQVGSPAVLAVSAEQIDLYYVGCTDTNARTNTSCEPQTGLGLGLARSQGGGAFAKVTHEEAPLETKDLPSAGITFLDVGAVQGKDGRRLLLSTGSGILLYRPAADDAGVEPVVDVTPVVAPGPAGAWDDATVCCATAVAEEDGGLLLWYAAQSSADAYPTWRVGLATSADGLHFEKSPQNPVLREGALEDFDGRGTAEPEVVYDDSRRLYRMWYAARAFLAGSSIGYAVSADGVIWHKFPGNPVVTPESLGLETVGAPAALVREDEIRLWVQGREPGNPSAYIYEVTNTGRDYAPP